MLGDLLQEALSASGEAVAGERGPAGPKGPAGPQGPAGPHLYPGARRRCRHRARPPHTRGSDSAITASRVSGAEEAPLNTWRIVHLASDEHGALSKRFELMSKGSGLPEYVERYIEDVLKNQLTKR